MGMKPRTKAEPPTLTSVEPEQHTLTSVEPEQRTLTINEIGVILLHAVVETMPPWYMACLSSETKNALKRARDAMVIHGLLVKRAED